MTSPDPGPRAAPDRAVALARSPKLYFAVALVAAVFAFLGAATSSYWTDELFTLFVVDHSGGLPEVMNRALTDTHPPAYYFLLYGWSRVFGVSETAVRVLSAGLAVAAAGLFFVALKGVFSRAARGFALAIGLNSIFWFDQAQNGRSYALCMLVSASLLALAISARRAVRDGRTPWGEAAGLVLAGLVGSFAHSYVFLEVGLVYLFLILGVRSLTLRAILVVAGAVIAGLYLAYARMLLSHTLQDVHHMWFRKDPVFFFNQVTTAWRIAFGISGIVAAALLGISAWRRRREVEVAPAAPVDRGWTTALALFVHLGMIVLGIVASFAVAPSMSSLNLATAAPMLWVLMAYLYDRGAPREAGGWARVLAVLLLVALAAHLPILIGRFLQRNEDWRGSARFVAEQPGCAGLPIAVVLPERFGPATPFFRRLAEQSFYGRYFPEPQRLHAYLPDELAGRKPAPGVSPLLAGRRAAGCPVLAWGVHDLELENAQALAADLARRPEVAPAKVVVKRFDHHSHEEVGYSTWVDAYVFLIQR